MTSVAPIEKISKIRVPFHAVLSFEVPTTEINPSMTPSVTFDAGVFNSQAEANKVYEPLFNHPAFIAAWAMWSLV